MTRRAATDRRRDLRDDRKPHAPAPAPARPEHQSTGAPPLEAMVESLQRSAGNAAVGQLLGRDGTARAGAAGGQPLPPTIQAAAERRLQTDLADVRLHTDSSAGDFAASLGAEAVTIGRDVFVGPRPDGFASKAGQKTLMHELTHTVQSSDGVAPLRGVSNPAGAAEREAAAVGDGGLYGAISSTTEIAPAGVAHRKVPDEEEPQAQPMPDFLNPQPLSEDELKESGVPQPPKAGELGDNEQVAFEIRVLAPFRGALAAAMDTEWETAVERMNLAAEAMWEYEEAYAKRNPAIATELRGIRGWLALAITQMRSRYSGKTFDDGHIQHLIEESITDMEKLGPRLSTRS